MEKYSSPNKTSFASETITYYNTIASGYDELYGEEQMKKFEFSINNGLNFKGKKVIDVGCGTGLITSKILEMGAKEVVGIDISEGMIEVAMKKYSGIKFMVGNALNIPYENEYFDVCVSFTVMQDLPKNLWKNFVKECLRVSKETWISFIKRGKKISEVIEIINILPNKILEDDKDYFLIFVKE